MNQKTPSPRFVFLLPVESEADGQGEFKRVLRAVGLEEASVIEEILHAGFQVDAKIWGEVVLCTEAK